MVAMVHHLQIQPNKVQMTRTARGGPWFSLLQSSRIDLLLLLGCYYIILIIAAAAALWLL